MNCNLKLTASHYCRVSWPVIVKVGVSKQLIDWPSPETIAAIINQLTSKGGRCVLLWTTEAEVEHVKQWVTRIEALHLQTTFC